jgi:hypothetical protein
MFAICGSRELETQFCLHLLLSPLTLPTGPLSFPKWLPSMSFFFFKSRFYIWEKTWYLSESGLFFLPWWSLVSSIFLQMTWFHSFLWLKHSPLCNCLLNLLFSLSKFFQELCIFLHRQSHNGGSASRQHPDGWSRGSDVNACKGGSCNLNLVIGASDTCSSGAYSELLG